MNVYSNILELVGKTPMLEVTNIDTGPCRLFLKLELMNPGGSIKDRIGISMIEEAEKRGDITPGDTIVEATAGNTGLGLALVVLGFAQDLDVLRSDDDISALLVIVVVLLYASGPAAQAVDIALVAVLLLMDTLDGIVARMRHEETLAGSILDVAADRAVADAERAGGRVDADGGEP